MENKLQDLAHKDANDHVDQQKMEPMHGETVNIEDLNQYE